MKHNKLIITIYTVLMVCIAPVVYSQNANSTDYSNSTAFGKGSNILSLGVGLGGNYTYFGPGYTATPNFVITYDNGTFGNVGPGTISLGALLSYKGIGYSYADYHSGYYYNQNWNYYIIGLRSAYHLSLPSIPRFDPYIGVMLGYYDIGYKESSDDPYFNDPRNPYYSYYVNNYSSYFAFSLYLGARYFVTDHVGFWLEIGYGYTDVALGVSFKL